MAPPHSTSPGVDAHADAEPCHANGDQKIERRPGDTDVADAELLPGYSTPPGDVNEPEWQWPCFEKWFSAAEGKWLTREADVPGGPRGKASAVDGLRCPFEVLSLINDEEDDPEVSVKIKSPPLIALVRRCLPRKVEALCEEPSIEARDLFAVRDELAAAATSASAAEERLHARHLLRFLRREFKDTLAKFSWMQQSGLVSYPMLWTFLVPGQHVRRACKLSGQPFHGVVLKSKYHDTYDEGNFFKVKVEVMDYNVQSYRTCTLEYKIPEFDGEVPFRYLDVCPLSFFSAEEKDAMEARWLRTGELFYSIAMEQPFRFMHYEGSLNYYERAPNGCWQLRRRYADGRAVVDLLSFAKINPDCPLENAKPPPELLRGVSAHEERRKERPSAEELKRGPGIVYGFSLSLKQWGCFEVEGLKEIAFNDRAYDQLVMRNGKQKEMLRGLVSTYLSTAEDEHKTVDVIAKKGEGCIVLCYGPPGTGKTLTAETLAESLHRPLWAISAFELGGEAGQLETSLRHVLNTALRWRAVVLLDEADGYLERRSDGVDVRRNLMTGVFLRLLEYFGGVLFLTTNRVRAFDGAFLSRISLCIRYPDLDDAERLLIWRSLLARAGLPDQAAPASLVAHGHPLNGREIRNIVALAQTWALSRRQPLSLADVHDTLDLVVAGSKELLQDPLSF